MTGPQLRERMIRQIKDINSEISAIESRIQMESQAISKLQDQIAKREEDVVSAKNYHIHAPKYESLFAKERQIKEFMASAPETLATEVANKEKLQKGIVALLRHISSQVIAQEGLPTDSTKLDELKADLTFKQKSQQQAEMTVVIVRQEMTKRQEELDRVNKLDVKIEAELKELANKMEQMRTTMAGYKAGEELKAEHEKEKARMEAELSELRRMRESNKLSLQQTNSTLDALERRVITNAYYKSITTLEKKLATQRQATESVAEVLAARKRDSDYDRIKKEALSIVNDLNNAHKSTAATVALPAVGTTGNAGSGVGGGLGGGGVMLGTMGRMGTARRI